jgi:GH15 family glucan-1,4-alpha-glucosidase
MGDHRDDVGREDRRRRGTGSDGRGGGDHRPSPERSLSARSDAADLAIERYGLIGDAGTAALVSDEGSIDWLCLPDFDGDPVFGRLLDPDGGHWSVRPVDLRAARRRYLPGTAILETSVTTGTGSVTIIDFFVVHPTSTQDALAPFRWICRRVEGIEGRVTLDVELAPRDPFGGGRWDLRATGRTACARKGGRALFAASTAPVAVERDVVTSRFDVGAGERHSLSLAFGDRDLGVLPPVGEPVERALERTTAWWRAWADRVTCAEAYRDAVVRSSLTLKLLTYAPSGAVVAAPTTSLPEAIGEGRNWDYRFSWVRDASRSVVALLGNGHPEDAKAYLFWIANATRLTAPRVETLYDLRGERVRPERALDGLRGYRGSRPVRRGNGAADQFQLDNWAYLADAALGFAAAGHEPPTGVWASVRGHADFAAANWRRPDHGIWEFRDRPRHFVHSKAMCWVAIDRALRLAEAIDTKAPRDRWRAAGEEIREAILRDGVDGTSGAFIRAFDDPVIDGSLLELSIVGFVEGDDPRMLATIDRVRHELGRDDLVLRYRTEDGLAGDEGAFLPCSFWLAHSLELAGRHDEAAEVFRAACGRANDVGLLPEEIDPDSGGFLGNFPQGLTHLALLAAARAIADQPNGR